MAAERRAAVDRETNETKVHVELNLDGRGDTTVETGVGMLDHLPSQIGRHGLIDLTISAKGDTHVGWHHLVEDVGILLGRALRQAVGDASGIMRTAHSYVPLDEVLALTAVDFGGRGYAVIHADIGNSDLGGLPGDLVRHFLESLAREAHHRCPDESCRSRHDKGLRGFTHRYATCCT